MMNTNNALIDYIIVRHEGSIVDDREYMFEGGRAHITIGMACEYSSCMHYVRIKNGSSGLMTAATIIRILVNAGYRVPEHFSREAERSTEEL